MRLYLDFACCTVTIMMIRSSHPVRLQQQRNNSVDITEGTQVDVAIEYRAVVTNNGPYDGDEVTDSFPLSSL